LFWPWLFVLAVGYLFWPWLFVLAVAIVLAMAICDWLWLFVTGRGYL
jgi:hypothetical protein